MRTIVGKWSKVDYIDCFFQKKRFKAENFEEYWEKIKKYFSGWGTSICSFQLGSLMTTEPLAKVGLLFKIKACEKFYRRHIVDIVVFAYLRE
jgi:hypothetical protein